MRQRLADRLDGMRRAVETIKAQPEMASIRTINLAVLAGEIRKLATAIHTEAASAQSDVIVDWAAGWRRPARRMSMTRTATTMPSRRCAPSC